ncbi:hypothetical protein I350_04533 [Cryptococcus amylolentus CBS 6273]|uniref:Uncharacterized protein n=1 Tax=Cryptococcus amylolentus CBS 6273 TaxID=1296118 RepID=A0A1E3JZZ6_9TREE|nr:hypothetical protein I350_04533 [Cryptococcus amylolentus CBS 6273]
MSAHSPQYIHGFSPIASSNPSPTSPHSYTCSPIEPGTLSFPKVPIPTSTTVSTDSEAGAFSSDWHSPCPGENAAGRSDAQSPSLISTLFSTGRSRQTSSTASTSGWPTPITPSTTGGVFSASEKPTKPILRRDTFSTSGEEGARDFFQGFDLSVPPKVLEEGHEGAGRVVKKRPSVLKFAVKPYLPPSPTLKSPYAPSSPRSRSRSTSTSFSGLSSGGQAYGGRSPAPPRVLGSAFDDEYDEDDDQDEGEEEDEDEEEEEFVESPIAIPGHESDSDEGYVEDEEDGFTSDEEDPSTNTFTLFPKFSNRPTPFAQPTASSSGHAHTSSQSTFQGNSTPRRRGRTLPPCPPSTDDCDNADVSAPFAGRKKRSISIVTDKPSTARCTRHRSPPPPSSTTAATREGGGLQKAPPAARSPSAAELCRRRGSNAAPMSAAPYPGGSPSKIRLPQPQIQTKGWKSDDSAFYPCRKEPQSASVIETRREQFPSPPPSSFALPFASGAAASRRGSGSVSGTAMGVGSSTSTGLGIVNNKRPSLPPSTTAPAVPRLSTTTISTSTAPPRKASLPLPSGGILRSASDFAQRSPIPASSSSTYTGIGTGPGTTSILSPSSTSTVHPHFNDMQPHASGHGRERAITISIGSGPKDGPGGSDGAGGVRMSRGEGLSRSFDGGFMGEMDVEREIALALQEPAHPAHSAHSRPLDRGIGQERALGELDERMEVVQF